MADQDIHPHLRDRFFQRYFQELTREVLFELIASARKTPGTPGDPDPRRRGIYHLNTSWRGNGVKLVWHPESGTILTFLAPYMKTFSRAKRKAK